MPDALTILSLLIEQIAHCLDEPSLVDLLRQTSFLTGAEAAFFASWFCQGTALASCHFLLACDPRWGLAYDEACCLDADPWLRYAMRHSAPLPSDRIACMDERERAVVELATSFGFHSAALVPAPAPSGSTHGGLLVLGSSRPAFFEGGRFHDLKVIARNIAMELQERHADLLRAAFVRERHITPADLRLLARAREGTSTKALAGFEGLSPGAVDARFRRLNAKFGSPNRETTARLAAGLGLL
ncbi:MAG TPA: autoinducer binding domain-containing protein [Caldimonas sp.]|nr:autoinducer binding domain-containing protein [Caldimonas sp.]